MINYHRYDNGINDGDDNDIKLMIRNINDVKHK